jgi:hypothetical protein
MRIAIVAAPALALLALVGCQQPPPPAPVIPGDIFAAPVAADGLVVAMALPDRTLVRGQRVPVTVTARNTGAKPITVVTDSSAAVYVTLGRRTLAGWEDIRRFPENTITENLVWTLAPGQSRSFTLTFNIGADWPSNEPLRLIAQLNGRPDARPQVSNIVVRQAEARK